VIQPRMKQFRPGCASVVADSISPGESSMTFPWRASRKARQRRRCASAIRTRPASVFGRSTIRRATGSAPSRTQPSSYKAGPLGFWHHRPVDLCAAVATGGMRSQPHKQSL
jgi:hypothetical protein